MATSVAALKSQLSGLEEYQPEDEATLRQRAENIYKPQYEQDLMSLRDSLSSQLATQARSALSNGMQRSSYNQAASASIRGAGLRSEAQLGAAYEGNVGAALANMMDKEKDRKDAADQYRNSLMLQLYNLEKARKGSGSGSYTPSPTNNSNGKDSLNFNPDSVLDGLKNVYTIVPNSGHDILKNGQLTSTVPQYVMDYAKAPTSIKTIQNRLKTGTSSIEKVSTKVTKPSNK